MSISGLETEKRQYENLVRELNTAVSRLSSITTNITNAKSVDNNYLVNDSPYSCDILREVESSFQSQIDTLKGSVIPSAEYKIRDFSNRIANERRAEEAAAQAALAAQNASNNSADANFSSSNRIASSMISRINRFIGKKR